MELSNQDKIRTFGEEESYKFLSILEADTIGQVQIEERIKKSQTPTRYKTMELKPYQKTKDPGCTHS